MLPGERGESAPGYGGAGTLTGLGGGGVLTSDGRWGT